MATMVQATREQTRSTGIAPRPVSAGELATWLASGTEVAVVDVRPDPQSDGGHLLRAVTVTTDELADRIGELIPRRSAPVVVYGAADDDADVELAVATLGHLGYTAVSTLDGGQTAWRRAGFETYDRDLALTKAFGEFVEQTRPTAGISSAELRRRLDAGDDIVLIDSRPFGEYQAATVPGAVNVPSGELLARFDDLVPSSATTVVVTCGGRTRAIVGAQVLVDAGVPNKVLALQNGTTGWILSGFGLEQGATRTAAPPSRAAARTASERARALGRRAGVREIDHATFEQWQREADEHTLYAFDVRTPEEHEAGHLRGSRWVAGGQLVQELNRHVAVLAGRIVLTDDADGARAFATASWLRQLGARNVFVLRDWPVEHTERAEGVAVVAREDRGNAITTASNLDLRRTNSLGYVAWCAQVVEQVARDTTHDFVRLAP
jgi:rhodanese-related sulfurtransferase